MLIKEDVEYTVRETAKMICAEQPDVPEPETLRDLDSFSFVQVILELENVFSLKILEALEDFNGETFGDLAGTIVDISARQQDAAEQPVMQGGPTGV